MSAAQVEIQVLAAVVAVACALPGVFLLLRRLAFMSDAISHAILFGIVLAIADLKESLLYQQIALETKKHMPSKAASSPIAKLAAKLLGNPFLRPTYDVHRPASDVHRPTHVDCSTPDVGRRPSDVETPPPEGAVTLA